MSSQAAQLVDRWGQPLHGAEVAPAPKRALRRIIASGANIYAGRFDFTNDPVDLRSAETRHETYRRMVTTDANIAETIRSNALPLLSRAVWDLACAVEKPVDPAMLRPRVDPIPGFPPKPVPFPPKKLGAKKVSDAEYEKHLDVRDLVAANLMGEENDHYGSQFWMSSPFTQFLREILKFIEHGYSLFHKESWIVEGKRVYRRLLWLEPQTVFRWIFSPYGEIEAVERRYPGPPNGAYIFETIPAGELMLFTWDFVGMRVEGTALIRPMFGGWKRKDFLLLAKVIKAQRAGIGMPYATFDPAAGTDGETPIADLLEDLLQSSLGSGMENAYSVLPNPSVKLEYLQQKGEDLKAFDGLVDAENASFAHAGGTQSGRLGETAGGNRALGEAMNKDKYVLVEAIGQCVAEQLLRGVVNLPGAINELSGWHPSAPDRRPYLRVSSVDPDEATKNITALNESIAKGSVKKRPQLEKMILDRLGFELDDDAFLDEGTPPPAGAIPPDPNLDPNAPPNPDAALTRRLSFRMGVEDMLRNPGTTSRESAQASGYGRAPTAFEEKVVAIGQVATSMRNGSSQLGAVLRRAHRQFIDELVGRVEAGKITRDSLSGLRRSLPKGKADREREVREQFLSIARQGNAHVRDELARQQGLAADLRAGKITRSSLKFESAPDPLGGTVLPKGAPIPTGGTRVRIDAEALLGELATEARVTSEISIDAVWSRLVTEAIGEFNRLQRQNLPDDEVRRQLESFLQDLSEKPVEQVARQVGTVAYNEGRDLAVKTAAADGIAGWEVRSAVLDASTCSPCAELDGTAFEIGSAEADANLPPAQCDGGDNCRCFVYAVASDLADAMQEVN